MLLGIMKHQDLTGAERSDSRGIADALINITPFLGFAPVFWPKLNDSQRRASSDCAPAIFGLARSHGLYGLIPRVLTVISQPSDIVCGGTVGSACRHSRSSFLRGSLNCKISLATNFREWGS